MEYMCIIYTYRYTVDIHIDDTVIGRKREELFNHWSETLSLPQLLYFDLLEKFRRSRVYYNDEIRIADFTLRAGRMLAVERNCHRTWTGAFEKRTTRLIAFPAI